MNIFYSRFHLVRFSPWPILLSITAGLFLFSLIITYKINIFITFSLLLISAIGWLNEIKFESSYEGSHTTKQNQILYYGFLLFLLSEILIFSTLFGSYIYNAINPSIEVYNKYPYYGIFTINPFSLPLFNTSLLYFSGLSCTIALSYINTRNNKSTINYFIITLFLSFLFTSIQYFEYNNASFTILDGIFSTNFYILTGFHGIHVIIGTIFLIYSLYRVLINTVRLNNSIGITSSSLYWHLVDFIWLILYILLYLWGS